MIHVNNMIRFALSRQTCLHWSRIPVPDSLSLQEQLFPQISRRNGNDVETRRPITRRHSTAGYSNDTSRRGELQRQATALPSLAIPQHPACPFCSKRLELTAGGESRFSKLVVQFEDGNISLSDI
mmetsp:Transcript_29452/g.54511  ORF Transcript_29452/g.54511 Transcript_29452/m.54511 type:complete len:125 (+) Transcript_29452:10-384(+)